MAHEHRLDRAAGRDEPTAGHSNERECGSQNAAKKLVAPGNFSDRAGDSSREMETHFLRNLIILVSLSGLSLACPANENTTTDSTTAATDATGGATDPTTSTSNGTTDGTDTGTTTDATISTSIEPTTTTDEPAPEIPICQEYAEHFVECLEAPDIVEDIRMACNDVFAAGAADGAACITALEAQYECLANLDCMEFQSPDPCVPETDAVLAACPSIVGEN